MNERNVDSLFNSYKRYGLKLFKQDVTAALMDAENPQQLGAYFAAAKKAYKAQICIDVVSEQTEIDWTPTLVVHIIKGIMGRAISRQRLIDTFATSGRTAANKSNDLHYMNDILDNIKPKALDRLESAELDMAAIISELKDKAYNGTL